MNLTRTVTRANVVKRLFIQFSVFLVALSGFFPLNPVQTEAAELNPKVCPTPVALINGDFAKPEGPGTYDNSVAGGGYYYADTVPGWQTTDVWRTPRGIIQIMDPARPSTIPPDTPNKENLTSRYAELNADQNSMLYQELPTTPGQTIYWRLDHRGYSGVDTMSVNIGPVTADPFNTTPEIMRISTGTTWKTYSGSYTVPAGQTVTRFGFKAISTSTGKVAFGNYLDNIFLGTEPCVVAEKTVSPEGKVYAGDVLTYEVTIKNNGGDIAANTVFEDAIPEGTEYIPGSIRIVNGPNAGALTDTDDQDAGHFDGQKVIIRLGDLPNTTNSPDGITVQFKVKALSSHAEGSVANIATIGYKNLLTGGNETIQSNNVTTSVQYREPHLEAEKTAGLFKKADGNTDAAHPEVGDTLQYTIQTRNTASDSRVTNLTITDEIPAGLEYVAGTLTVDGVQVTDDQDGDKGYFANRKIFGQFGDVTDTAWHKVTFQVKVQPGQAGNDIQNVAVVDGDNVTTPSTPKQIVEVYPRETSLESTKTAKLFEKASGNTDATNPEVGDMLEYTIQTRNNIKDSLVKNLTITDDIPAGLQYVPGTLKVDGAAVTDAEGDDAGHFTDGKVFAQFGNVMDTNWHEVTFQVKVLPGQAGKVIRNIAVVDGDNVNTPKTPENAVEVYPRKTSLESAKTAELLDKAAGNTDTVHPEVGDTLKYTIQTRNTASDSLVTNLTITDEIPAGLEYVAGTLTVDDVQVTDDQDGDNGHFANRKIFGQFGDVTDTAWHKVTFQVKVLPGQAGKNIRNVAVVNGDNITTPSTPEKVVEVYPRENALESTKTAELFKKADGNTDAAHPEVGDTLHYTIQTRNTASDSRVTDLTITDEIPAGLEYVAGTLTVDDVQVTDDQDGDKGHFANGKIFGQFGDVTDTAWHKVTFQAKVLPGQAGKNIINIAAVEGDNIGTPDRPRNEVEVYPRNPQIETKKSAANTVSKATYEVGDTIAYTIRVRGVVNDTYLENLTITDTLPAGLKYVPDSLKVDGASVTDENDNDAGYSVTGEVYGSFGNVMGINWHTLEFKAVIQPGQGGKTIENTALVEGDNITQPGTPTEKVVVEPEPPVNPPVDPPVDPDPPVEPPVDPPVDPVDPPVTPPVDPGTDPGTSPGTTPNPGTGTDPGKPNQVPSVPSYTTETTINTPATGKIEGTDADGDKLTYTKGSDPKHGTVTVNPDGTWTYVPERDYTGSDSFTVIVSDGRGGTVTSVVTVNVKGTETGTTVPGTTPEPTNPGSGTTPTNPGTGTTPTHPGKGTAPDAGDGSGSPFGDNGTVAGESGKAPSPADQTGMQSGSKLPNTATNVYNLGFLGLIILFAGWLFWRKNKAQ